MAVTNNNIKQVDLPTWEWLRFAPTATQAISALTTHEQGTDRYLYYLTGAVFYRYDTYTDTYQQLATPNVAASVGCSMRYTKRRGYHGKVLAATNSTVTIAGLRGMTFNGDTISIESGTGAGQERTLSFTDFANETINDAGVVTTVATNYLADSTKKWKFNQWAGYIVAITFGTDSTQYKKILYNDTTTLYVTDANLQMHEPWNNQAYVANAPYALPVATAGAQSHYQILSHTFSLNSNWTVTPDDTSYFTIKTGGIYLFSSAAAAPFMSLQYYDIAHDQWQTKTCPQGLIGAAFGTDMSIERFAKLNSYVSSTATSGGSRTLIDTTQTMPNDRYKNYRIEIVGGTGIGQNRRIVCNTATTFTLARPWAINPDSTSQYKVWGDYNKLLLAGNGASAMYEYNIEKDMWLQGAGFEEGLTTNISCTHGSYVPFGISTGTYIAAGILTVDTVPTAGGTGYTVGDILTCAVGGAGAKVIVTSTGASGAVTGIQLVCSGTTTGYTTGTGKATTGGTGTSCTISILTVGVTCYVTTATNHWLGTGDIVTIAGCTVAAYNSTFTILGVDSLTTFSIAVPGAAASMVASNSQSVTTIVDPTKNWIVNEHAGRILHLCVAGTAPTSQMRWIVSNTATTLTVATIVAGVNGTSKYAIYDAKAFGRDDQFKPAVQQNYGHATGGSTTTLIDTTKNWVVNQWAGYKLKIEAGTGYGSGIISVVSNTATTLTYATQTFTPDATTHYEIADTWGLMTAGSAASITETTTKNWAVNLFAGKRVRIIAGTGAGQEAIIASNTATVLTTGAITAPDATSVYTILGCPAKGSGIELMWMFGCSASIMAGRYIGCLRGSASNGVDCYDVTTEKWKLSYFMSPQQETFSTGSMYAYDGVDTIYIQKDSTGRIFAYNTLTNSMDNVGMVPYGMSTATIGNRMEVIQTADGLKYLYVMRHTGNEMWRTLIW